MAGEHAKEIASLRLGIARLESEIEQTEGLVAEMEEQLAATRASRDTLRERLRVAAEATVAE
eukprot:2025530-Alexandrium_andersonii.AAC.1